MESIKHMSVRSRQQLSLTSYSNSDCIQVMRGFKSKPSCCTAYASLCKKQPACCRLLTGHPAVVRTAHDPRLEAIGIAATPTARGLHAARLLVTNVLFLHCGLHAVVISSSNTDCKLASR